MGKFRSKLKGQSKGKRWPKGQSASSNPETHKHRDLAKSRFFQANLGSNSNLTSEALRKHDAVQAFIPTTKNKIEQTSVAMEDVEEDTASSFGTHSSYKTMASFASEWSDCSNMSYNRFLKVFRSDSALHKEMLAVLAAIAEVIKEQNGTESPTEYYCALLTTLEQVYESDVKSVYQVTAILSLLSMGIKTVPEPVLRSTFEQACSKMMRILQDYADTDAENNAVIKAVFNVLATLLRVQEQSAWSNSSLQTMFYQILDPFCIHSKPKWRKGAQQAVIAIVKGNHFVENSTQNPPADKVADFCIQKIETYITNSTVSSAMGQTTVLHILGLMKETISNFSKTQIKRCGEMILRLMTLNSPLINSCGLQVLHALFSSQKAVISAKVNAQLIAAVYEYQPAQTDVQPTLAWLAVMQQAYIHLADVDSDMACTALPKFFTTLTQLWLSEKPEIMNSATHTLEVLLKDAIAPICNASSKELQHKSKIAKCFNAIELGLGYQYNMVWHQVLHVIGVMFDAGGANCSELFLNTLKSLAELRDSYKFSYNNELEHAVGAAVRALGPEVVLNVISLKKENGDLNLDRSWMLPVLKENIKGSTLNYFINGILPLAIYCQRRSNKLAQINDGIGAHSSELLYMQLWNLLPCFCIHPTDIKENFKSLAKILGTAISDRKELRLAVMASLRKLINSAKETQNEEDIQEIARFDKNYLPILFNVYSTKPIGSDEEGQRLAALDTIKLYLTISKPTLNEQLFMNALERLNSSSEDPEDSFIKEGILDLIRALVPYQTTANITVLYNQCVKTLPEIKHNKEQKKAYRILEEICGSPAESCKEFVKINRKDVQKLLMKSLDTAAVSSKGARLRCLNYLVKAQPQLDHDSKLIRSIIPEAVLCCKDINEKTRSIAYDILNTIGETLMQHDQIQQFIEIVVAGLAGTTQIMSCTILALASILHNFSGSLGADNIELILENIATLCSSPTREIVAACLSFIKVYLTAIPSPMVAASLKTVVKALTCMTEDCKRHFRLKTRDILDRLVRKYGCESITPYIPVSDTVMYKRLRNLRKLNARKKKMKETEKEQDNGSDSDEDFIVKSKPKSVEDILADSDSDFEDMETDQPKPKIVKNKKKQSNTWIEEDPDSIVDFTDPSVSSKITATRPGQAPAQIAEKKKPEKKDRGFKTAPDGRLIIKDDGSDSDGDNAGKKKTKFNFNSDSDSDDNDGSQSVAETLVLSDRKRKRSASSVKSGVSTASSQPPSKYKTGGIGIHRSLGGASTSTSVYSGHAGSEYKPKKATGDVKRKGKVDPYAYLPLQRNALNKRKKLKAAGQFKSIVKAAKSGALKGAKAKKNRTKK